MVHGISFEVCASLPVYLSRSVSHLLQKESMTGLQRPDPGQRHELSQDMQEKPGLATLLFVKMQAKHGTLCGICPHQD